MYIFDLTDISCSLSSPFMDASSACGFFDLILGLFVEADVNAAGKLVGESCPTEQFNIRA